MVGQRKKNGLDVFHPVWQRVIFFSVKERQLLTLWQQADCSSTELTCSIYPEVSIHPEKEEHRPTATPYVLLNRLARKKRKYFEYIHTYLLAFCPYLVSRCMHACMHDVLHVSTRCLIDMYRDVVLLVPTHTRPSCLKQTAESVPGSVPSIVTQSPFTGCYLITTWKKLCRWWMKRPHDCTITTLRLSGRIHRAPNKGHQSTDRGESAQPYYIDWLSLTVRQYLVAWKKSLLPMK